MRSLVTIVVVVVIVLALTVQAAVVDQYWNITYAQANPAGLKERRVIGVNNTWPPPPITLTQGDLLRLHVTNGLGDPDIGTAIHVHGMFFNGTSYYDGAVGITQCSIPDGREMIYEIDSGLQTGTFWIHGHYLGQYVDGLRSPVIILPNNDTGRNDNVIWDDEYTLLVSDWYNDEHRELLDYFLSWKNPTGAEPVPDAAAIYVMHDGKYSPSAEAVRDGTATNDQASMLFQPGKTYKIRIINMSALAMFHIKLDGHEMSIIESDGVELEPYPVDVLEIAVAQRYSVSVKAREQGGQNWAMAVMQDPDMYDFLPDDLVLNNTVQIIYDESAPLAEAIEVEEWPDLDDSCFVPVLKMEMAPADIEYRLDVWFDTYDDGSNRGTFNNITFQEPKTPSIFTALTMGNDSFLPQVYGAQTNAFAYPHMANIELTVYNWDDGFHPFHFHGHEFQLVKKSFDVTEDDSLPDEVQLNPSRRDTVTIPPRGKVVLRWRADNPGAWFFHCHVDWHLSSGLAAVFIEAPEKLQENTIIPSVLYDQCKYWDLPTSGNVVGKDSTTDFKGQPWGPFPLKTGWNKGSSIAMSLCIFSALVGCAGIIWYGFAQLDVDEVESQVKRKMDAKLARKRIGAGQRWASLYGLVGNKK
ncbi:Cupredoxin [Naematelia encephala]|uniref:Cupredoxin n=1 Tax=Naematelia encephala TaxID=71784 RepID=A0A1Y2B854_9TREE|nr:Cupredoxin [Naematelia encephala]